MCPLFLKSRFVLSLTVSLTGYNAPRGTAVLSVARAFQVNVLVVENVTFLTHLLMFNDKEKTSATCRRIAPTAHTLLLDRLLSYFDLFAWASRSVCQLVALASSLD